MTWTRRYDEAESQRVNRWLAQSGVCSRREADALIADGLVRIDGVVVTEAGRKIAPGETLTLDDAAAAAAGTALSVVVHKPMGVVSAHPEPDQVEARALLIPEGFWSAESGSACPTLPDSLPPVGRLDRDSRGLLLLSADGVVARSVIAPDADTPKEYLVRVAGELTPKKLALLRFGLRLDGRQLKKARVSEDPDGRLRIVLREGRNRQIRRMAELVGLRVTDLQRIRIGPVQLRDLPEGRWRPLTGAERAALLDPSPRGEGRPARQASMGQVST